MAGGGADLEGQLKVERGLVIIIRGRRRGVPLAHGAVEEREAPLQKVAGHFRAAES